VIRRGVVVNVQRDKKTHKKYETKRENRTNS
jgi:hypothetical protein